MYVMHNNGGGYREAHSYLVGVLKRPRLCQSNPAHALLHVCERMSENRVPGLIVPVSRVHHETHVVCTCELVKIPSYHPRHYGHEYGSC